jgi:hypothetical protein
MKSKSGWYKIESFNAQGWSRGLAYFPSLAEAQAMAAKWRRMPSCVTVKVSVA